jgi:Family of unknown function (DUF6941)
MEQSMPKVVWALTCTEAEITPEDRLVIQNEFMNLRFESFPATIPKFFIATRIAGRPGKVITLQTRLLSHVGEVIYKKDHGERQIQSDGYIVTVLECGEYDIPMAGRYRIELWINKYRAHSQYLLIAGTQNQKSKDKKGA